MNNVDKNPDYKKIYEIVRSKFKKTAHFYYGPFDETYYTMRVYESSKNIVTLIKQKVKIQQLLTAALLHDIGKIKLKPSKLFKRSTFAENHGKEWEKHPQLSVPIASNILKRMGHSNEFIEEVCYLIKNHSMRKKNFPKTIELKILQDADLIADIGLAGFLRPFMFSGKFFRSVIETINFIKNEDRTSGGSNINLKVSKVIAKKEMKIQKNLIKESLKEINSNLL